MASLEIRRLERQEGKIAARWDRFVLSCPNATFFHRSGWQRVIWETFRHPSYFLYAERNGEIEGVLPLTHVKSLLFGNSLVALPFAVYGGVAAESDEAAFALECEAEKIANQLGVHHLEYRNVIQRHSDWPTQDLYVCFRKEIQPSLDANMLAIPRKQRAMVRKGISSGLVSEIDRNVERFFALYADNVHRHGTPAFPKRYFEKLQCVFGDDCEVLIVQSAEGRALSGVFSFYFRDEVLPYYAGDVSAARNTAANDFKYWELLRRSCERGIKIFDYGRSKKGTGSYSFKVNWGFEPKALYYEYRLFNRETIPQHNPSNPKYRVMIKCWRKMPLWLANTIGPHIARNLG